MADKFDSLKSSLTAGRVLLPGDDDFKDSLRRWSASCVKPAAVVVMPATAAEVSTSVKWANAHSVPFTVCCGGHSSSAQSSISGGMVIDLRRMRAVSVDPEARTVTFEGGCLWSDVDEACWTHELATPGGWVSHTGVGGLILGGGFGFLTPRDGLTIDCLLEVEVVLADGSIVTASEATHPDLFWAMRGAGSSFGVATRFTSRIFPQGPVWCGPLLFPTPRIPEVVAAANEVLAAHPSEAAAVVTLLHSPPQPPEGQRAPLVAVMAFYNGPKAAGEAAFAPVLKLEPLAAMAVEVPYPVVNTLSNEMLPHMARYQFGAANIQYPMNPAVVQAAADMWFAGIEEMSANAEVADELRGSFIMFEGIPNQKIREVAPTATAFANRGEYYNVAVLMKWENAENDAKVRAFKQKVAALIRALGFQGDRAGIKGVGQYNNYMEDEMEADGAFGGNAHRLKELKAKYDPQNRFNKLWKLGPILK